MIVEGSGDNFRSTGTALINQQNQGIIGFGLFGTGFKTQLIGRVAPLGINDQALGKKQIGNGNRLVQQTSGVVAQIKNQPLETIVVFGANLLELLLQFNRGAFLKLAHAGVGIARLKSSGTDTVELDDFANQFKIETTFDARTQNPEGDFFTNLATHHIDGLHQIKILGWMIVDAHNLVTGLDSGSLGRSTVQGRNHQQGVFFESHFNPDPAEFPLGIGLHLLIKLGRQKTTVGVEGLQHATNSTVNQTVQIDLFNIVALNDGQGVGEQFQLNIGVIRLRRRFLLLGKRRPCQRQTNNDYQENCAHIFINPSCNYSPRSGRGRHGTGICRPDGDR